MLAAMLDAFFSSGEIYPGAEGKREASAQLVLHCGLNQVFPGTKALCLLSAQGYALTCIVILVDFCLEKVRHKLNS